DELARFCVGSAHACGGPRGGITLPPGTISMSAFDGVCSVDAAGDVRTHTAAGVAQVPAAHGATRCRSGVGYCALPASGAPTCWADGVERLLVTQSGREVDLDDGLGVATRRAAAEGSVLVDLIPFGESVCGVLRDGHVVCWTSWQESREVCRRELVGIADVTQLELVGEYGCAREASGRVVCWLVSTCDVPLRAVEVLSSGAESIAVGFHYGCALVTDGRVRCWGTMRDPNAVATNPDHSMLFDVPL
ncbi:MAG: hypothetical protein K8H88_16915, partial [Sandaracinaceae bacterium]|nr:hypothetical protein [Sandaracinaceae bacterium]